MGVGGVVVVIGAPALRDTLTAALPDVHIALADSLVEGVWLAGQNSCRGVVVELVDALPAEAATRALRSVLGEQRLVAACSPIDEPLARSAVDCGFDDYVVVPCGAGELLSALHIQPPAAAPTAVPIEAHRQVLSSLEESLREAARWQELASRDELTGLHNRRAFDAAVERAVAAAGDSRRAVTVIYFDFDDFKAYNQRFGRAAGDSLLREFARLLQRCTRASDVLARVDGDAFAVALLDDGVPRRPGSQHPRDAALVTSRFRGPLDAQAYSQLGRDRPGPLSATGGLASYPWDARSPGELLVSAENALLSAKRIGAGRFLVAGPAAAM